MSLHPSLKQGDTKGSSRTVMKRNERIKKLMEEGKWNDKSKVFGLPKVKVIRMKVAKKEKKQETQEKESPEATKQTTKQENKK